MTIPNRPTIRPRPRHHLSISLRKDQYERLSRLAQVEHTSLAYQVRRALDASLPKQKASK